MAKGIEVVYGTKYEREFIEKFDGEAAGGNGGLSFDPTDTGKAKAVTISDEYGSLFSAAAYSALVTLNGSGRTQGIYLLGNGNKNSVVGGAGADTLSGGDGNDTLVGGGGADVFIGSLGKDYIADYNANEGDVIRLGANVSPTKVKVSKQNVVITGSDKSTFTVVNGKGVELKVVDANGEVVNSLNQAFGDVELVAGSATAVVDSSLNTSMKVIDGREAKGSNYKTSEAWSHDSPGLSEGVSLIGNASANTIYGSNYVNSTIYGGAGKDVLIGGSGTQVSVSATYGVSPQTVPVVNTFVFTEGNGANTISNYQAGDRIWIKSGSITGYTIKKSDVILTVALNNKKKSTITVSEAKNKTLTVLTNTGEVDTANTRVYRDATDYIVTDQASVTSAVTGDKVKLIDAGSEYTTLAGYTDNGVPISREASIGHNGIYIEGNKLANTIIGSKYGDTIRGGAGKDTIYGGHEETLESYDTFVYEVGDGNEVIMDYMGSSDVSKSDVIRLGEGAKIWAAGVVTSKGASDVVLTIGSLTGKSKGKVTLKGAKDKMVVIVGSDGRAISPQAMGGTSLVAGRSIYSVDRVLNMSNNSSAVTLDASSETSAAWVIGNSSKNVIVASHLANTTLEPGGGNDTMYGDTMRAVSYVFGATDGSNVIYDYDPAHDEIALATTDVSISASALVTKKGARDLALTIGKTKVSLRGILDTVEAESTTSKGRSVSYTRYVVPKVTIRVAETGAWYRMAYGAALCKVDDGDVVPGGALDFGGAGGGAA